MQAKIIDGKMLAKKIQAEIAETVSADKQRGIRPPCLAVILVGNNPASEIYVRNKREACEAVGMKSLSHILDASVTEDALHDLIDSLNKNPEVDGILLQLPLPEHINAGRVLEAIDPEKDVDGFHPYNLGRLAQRRPAIRPCTPRGVMTILDEIGEVYKKRHAVIVGASNIVGRPMALELLLAGATITICHRFTGNLAPFVAEADILVSATGIPGIIKGEWIKPGATVIDVGITRLSNGKLAGDIEFASACERAAWITPVPGGVGPLTVAMLLKNTLEAAKR